MTTSVFPGAADNDSNLYRVINTDTIIPGMHNNLNDAIQAIEGALLDGSSDLAMKASGTGHQGGLVPDPGATAGTTKYLREDGTWDVPAGGGGFANFTQYLAADVPMSSSGTYYDGAALTLGAGVWLLIGGVTIADAVSGAATAVIRDSGGTVYSAQSAPLFVSSGYTSISVQAIVSPGTTTEYIVSAKASAVSSAALKAQAYGQATNTGTYLLAIQIG